MYYRVASPLDMRGRSFTWDGKGAVSEIEAELERLWVERQAGPLEIVVDDVEGLSAACWGASRQEFRVWFSRLTVDRYRSKWTGMLDVVVAGAASVDKSESIMCEWAACHGRGR